MAGTSGGAAREVGHDANAHRVAMTWSGARMMSGASGRFGTIVKAKIAALTARGAVEELERADTFDDF